MNTFIKWLLITLVGLAVIGFIGFSFLRNNTKKHSPEQTVTHTVNDLNFSIFYNRPYKKGRDIFGDLVPYNKVWRTGANEATTFTTDKDVSIDGSLLKAGTYTIWTIPNENSWKVIFNTEEYGWGVNMDGTVKRDPAHDALTIEVPVHRLLNVVEQFSIYFEDANGFTILYLAWDTTSIAIPIHHK